MWGGRGKYLKVFEDSYLRGWQCWHRGLVLIPTDTLTYTRRPRMIWTSKRFNLEYTGFDLTLRSAIENDCYRYTRDQEVTS